MKKLLVVLAILFIGILLAGCTSQPAAPVATPTPTVVATPVPTTVATPEPTKVIVVVVENKTVNVTPTMTATPTPAPVFTITFTQDMTIIPSTSATIPVGGQVKWVNNDSLKPHSVMATDATDGAWFGGSTTATIPFGQPLTVTFNKAGVYEYTTVFQPQTTGSIIVK